MVEVLNLPEAMAPVIYAQRELIAENMLISGTPGARLQQTLGVCAADSNRMPDGELAFAEHGIAHVENETEHSLTVVRATLVKPRTSTGWTGLMHQPGGMETYLQGVRRILSKNGLIAAEIMDESDFAIASTRLAMAWIGARNVEDTGPRYLARPTTEDIDNGAHPIPTFVKSGQDGSLEATVRALETIMSDTPETRTRFTSQGLENVTTHANPHVGVILAGSKIRPEGPTKLILSEEIWNAREKLDAEFGKNVVPIHVDFSHRHAAWEGGGEAGQLTIARAMAEIILESVPVDGVMAETYMISGKQLAGGKIPGLSWTDGCVGDIRALDMQRQMDRAWGKRPLAAA
ncbi:MAG: hypothetical protein ABWX94_00465 [Candidatus Saccharimonadales bacterium]